MEQNQLWQSVLENLEVEISKANFATWLKYTSISSIKDSELIISVPNHFTKEWLQNKYNKLIINTVRNIKPEITKIQYIVGKENNNNDDQKKSADSGINKTLIEIKRNIRITKLWSKLLFRRIPIIGSN